ncbi:hypothetical protein GZL_08295 [Streptomyces sp. 769]|nr:hypothetical protein GZL_08295 [Streptomyces sp. 769]
MVAGRPVRHRPFRAVLRMNNNSSVSALAGNACSPCSEGISGDCGRGNQR